MPLIHRLFIIASFIVSLLIHNTIANGSNTLINHIHGSYKVIHAGVDMKYSIKSLSPLIRPLTEKITVSPTYDSWMKTLDRILVVENRDILIDTFLFPHKVYGFTPNDIKPYYYFWSQSSPDTNHRNLTELFNFEGFIKFETAMEIMTYEEKIKLLNDLGNKFYKLNKILNLTLKTTSSTIYVNKSECKVYILFSLHTLISSDDSNTELTLSGSGRKSILYFIHNVIKATGILDIDFKTTDTDIVDAINFLKHRPIGSFFDSSKSILSIETILDFYIEQEPKHFDKVKYEVALKLYKIFSEIEESYDLLNSFFHFQEVLSIYSLIHHDISKYDVFNSKLSVNDITYNIGRKIKYPRHSADFTLYMKSTDCEYPCKVLSFQKIKAMHDVLLKRQGFYIPILITKYNKNSRYHLVMSDEVQSKKSIVHDRSTLVELEEAFKQTDLGFEDLVLVFSKYFHMLDTIIELDVQGINIVPYYATSISAKEFSIIPIFSYSQSMSSVLSRIFLSLKDKLNSLSGHKKPLIEVDSLFINALNNRNYQDVAKILPLIKTDIIKLMKEIKRSY